jgi:predicted DNA-binding antitoxin AbrB/MazE fold protein
MVKTVEAVFDGKVFRPTEQIELAPNTRVRMTIETMPTAEDKTASFLQTARTLNLDGPSDWSDNLDDYLYGGETSRAE